MGGGYNHFAGRFVISSFLIDLLHLPFCLILHDKAFESSVLSMVQLSCFFFFVHLCLSFVAINFNINILPCHFISALLATHFPSAIFSTKDSMEDFYKA